MKWGEVEVSLFQLDALTGLPEKISYAYARVRPQLIKARDEVRLRRKDAYDEKAKAYIEGAQEIAREHAKHDSEGIPLLTADKTGFQIADLAAFKEAMAVFDEKHAEGKAAFKIQDQALADWLNEDLVIHRWAADFELIVARGSMPPTSEIVLLCEVLDFEPPSKNATKENS